jgi:hypothetical protein
MRGYRSLLMCFALLTSGCAVGQNSGLLDPGNPNTSADQTESLADRARRLRSSKPKEAQTTEQDAKTLFRSVEEIFAFASKDTGFPIRQSVKRRLIGREDVEKQVRDGMTKADLAEHFARTELTMKKFGLLPRDFDIREFMVKSSGQEVAGYYDPKTKTISLVNWMPLEQLHPVLAHELTHALQDQNYDLDKWAEAGRARSGLQPDSTMDETVLARHAVAEGQAMIVYIDYMLAPYGRNLRNTPGVLARMEEPAVTAVVDTEFLHKAPMIMREAGTFPYRNGLIFEGELLEKGGTAMAFAGAFARPPRNTHEVLQPRAYIEREEIPPVRIPDVKGLLGGNYEIYDSGVVGELDVEALLKQYGERHIADQLAANWRGGTYIACKRAEVAGSATTGDVALLYVSRWKSEKAAARFAEVYGAAVATRYRKPSPQAQVTCSDADCPLWRSEIATEEGPVIVERWPENTVIVSESFEASTAAQLRQAVRKGGASLHAQDAPQDELSSRLYQLPAFRRFQAELGERILREVERRSLSSEDDKDERPTPKAH